MKTTQRADLLRQIRSAFSRLRREGTERGPMYPVELRRLAVAAVNQGCSPAAVADAAGCCRQTLSNWREEIRGKRPEPRAVELRLIAERAPARAVTTQPTARILFRSGVSMELSVSAVTREFVTALQGAQS